MNVLDRNDVSFIEERFSNIVGSEPCPKNGTKINPHVSRFFLDDNSVLDVFHIKPVYYQHVDESWRPMYEVMSHHGNTLMVLRYEKMDEVHPDFLRWLIHRQSFLRNGKLLITDPFTSDQSYQLTDQLGIVGAAQISFTTTSVYPDPNPETTTTDAWGRVLKSGAGFNWSDLSTSAGQYADPSDTALYIGFQDNATDDRWTQIYRSITLFDTSAVSTDTVDSAVYSLYATGNQSAAGTNLNANIFTSSPASNTDVAAADMTITNFGSTQLATGIARGSISTSSYNDWTLNATGEATINGSGVTKLGCILEDDRSNTEPTHDNNGSAGFSRFYASSAEASGTAQDPKLVVNHSAGGPLLTPTTQGLTFSLPTYTVGIGANQTANTQTATFDVPARTVTASVTELPTTLEATFSLPGFTIDLAGNITHSPSTQGLTFSIPAYSAVINNNVIEIETSLVFSLVPRTVSITNSLTATVLESTFSTPSNTVTTEFNVTGSKIVPNLTLKRERVIINI